MTGDGLPLAATVHSASPGEVTLIEGLLEQRVLKRKLPRLIYDRAADSDPLRVRLTQQGTELICPHRKNRKKPPTQDGRKLRRYKRRWKVERLNAWLQNFRRLIDQQDLVEETGEVTSETGGRPAKLFRFRGEVLAERAVAGSKLPVVRAV